jgi:GDP-4-dehydro-6-deoxy-D-mannose reductase
MRCFVTGAAGFAGSHLAELLLARGDVVFGLVQPDVPDENLAAARAGPHGGRLHALAGDLLDRPGLTRLLREAGPDQVYHLAALSSVRQSLDDPAAAFRLNVQGTQTLLDAVLEAGLRPRVLYVGSGEAYGQSMALGRPVREEDALLPVTPYGTSKAAAERVVTRYVGEQGLHLVRVRPFPHTGPRHAPQFVFPDLARQLAEIEAGVRPPRIEVGNLEVQRDLSDVRDMVRAYVLGLEQAAPGAVYNLCSGQVWTLRDVLALLIRLSGARVEVTVRHERLRAQDLAVLAGDPSAFRALTGWGPTIPLERTLADLLDHWRARQAVEREA